MSSPVTSNVYQQESVHTLRIENIMIQKIKPLPHQWEEPEKSHGTNTLDQSDMTNTIGWILQIGVMLSAATILLGIILGSLFLGGTSLKGTATTVSHLHFSLSVVLLIFVGSVLAGVVGSLVGLGGGIMIVSMFMILFGFPLSFAIGASIISV